MMRCCLGDVDAHCCDCWKRWLISWIRLRMTASWTILLRKPTSETSRNVSQYDRHTLWKYPARLRPSRAAADWFVRDKKSLLIHCCREARLKWELRRPDHCSSLKASLIDGYCPDDIMLRRKSGKLDPHMFGRNGASYILGTARS